MVKAIVISSTRFSSNSWIDIYEKKILNDPLLVKMVGGVLRPSHTLSNHLIML
jgi:hypothetical protein